MVIRFNGQVIASVRYQLINLLSLKCNFTCRFCVGTANVAGITRSTNGTIRTYSSESYIRRIQRGIQRSKMSGHQQREKTKKGWIDFEKYSVYARSISGLETSVVVKSDDLLVAFDMGYAADESVRCKNVFISHGHMDHIAAVPHHAAKRSLFGMPKAKYYVPPHLVSTLQTVCNGYFEMAETTEGLSNMNILPFHPDGKIKISNKYSMTTFPTVHRITSQGYILYNQSKVLKPEYQGLDASTISAKIKQGETIHDIKITPDVAFTGDTTFDIFQNVSNPDLLKVKILIAEATYIDQETNKDTVMTARERGHTHLQEFIDNEHLFQDIQHIVLIHFSDKYSSSYIRNTVYSLLPDSLQNKVHVSTYAKDISQ